MLASRAAILMNPEGLGGSAAISKWLLRSADGLHVTARPATAPIMLIEDGDGRQG